MRHLHLRLHGASSRKIILLLLIIFALFFDFGIISLGEKISHEADSLGNSQRIASPWEYKIKDIVRGTPMEKMAPYISLRQKATAAFLVSVAKKESGLGKHAPKLDGDDCYNYWGFRDQNLPTTESGFTCFSGPRQAIAVVSKRFDQLIVEEKRDTPEEMVVAWKCGYDCSWDNPAAVEKWINDVDYYFQKIYR